MGKRNCMARISSRANMAALFHVPGSRSVADAALARLRARVLSASGIIAIILSVLSPVSAERFGTGSVQSEVTRPAAPAPGSPAPDFYVISSDGESISKSSVRGKAVLLHFWASSSDASREQISLVRTLRRMFDEREFVVIGASLDGNCEDSGETAKRLGIVWTNVCDGRGSEGPLAKSFGISGVPAVRLIDREGTIAGSDLSPERLRTAAAEVVTESKIGRFARESRRELQWKVGDIFEAMAVRQGSRVADVGAGEGFISVRLSSEVGAGGSVFAVDIDETALGELRRRIQKAGLNNVDVIRGRESDPLLAPGSLDSVLVLRSYHEFTRYREMLAKIRDALKPRGRLVIVDVKPDTDGAARTREWQVQQHVMTHEIVERDLEQAGFRIIRTSDPFAQVNSRETAWLICAEKGPPAS